MSIIPGGVLRAHYPGFARMRRPPRRPAPGPFPPLYFVPGRESAFRSVAARPPALVARFRLAFIASLLVLDFTRSLWQEGSPSHRPATWPRCFISFRPRSGARLHRLRLIWALLRFAIATPFTLPRFSLKPNWRILNSIFT